MRRCLTRNGPILVGLGLVLFLGTFSAQSSTSSESEYEEYSAKPVGFWRQLEWTQIHPEGERIAQGLLLTEAADRGMVERLAYEGSNGRRLVVTRTAAPRQGRLVERLHDDSSGWWIELQLDFKHRWNGWRHFAFTLDEVFYPGSKRTIHGRLSTSQGLELELPLRPVQGGLPDTESFSRALGKSQATGRLFESIPQAIRPALHELRTVLSNPTDIGTGSVWFIDVLAELVPEPSDHGDEHDGWTQKAGKIHSGLGVSEPETLAFVSRFRGLSNADPLGDHRLADVVPVENR